jgi:hypothetical protein
MNRSPAYDDLPQYASERTQLAVVDSDEHGPSAANAVARRSSIVDMQQAKHFQALLEERHSHILREIHQQTAALVLGKADDDTGAMRRLRRDLAAIYREQVELDRLRHSVRVRLAADLQRIGTVDRCFEIVMIRRRTGWRMEIPEFDVVLGNIDSRTAAEVVGRSIRVQSRLGRRSSQRSPQ